MARGIRISWAMSRYVFGKHDGIRLRMTASDACDMTDKIFAYRMLPINPATGDTAGFFSHVCSPPDIEEYPANEPIDGHRPEWFRLDYVDILVRSLDEAENFRAAVVDDIRRLKTTLDVLDEVTPAGTEDVGDICLEEPPPAEESSDSSVPSDSSESSGPLLTLTATGTSEQNIGDTGLDWASTLAGAGSPVDGTNYSQVTLYPAFSSKLLLIQGYDFSALPDDAQIAGISLQLRLRWIEFDLDVEYYPRITFLALHHPELGLVESAAEDDPIPGTAYDNVDAGGEDELWGKVWTPALLKRGEFGAAIIVHLPVEAGIEVDLATIQIDAAPITIHYR